MSLLSLQNFTTLVQNQAAAVQARAAQLVNLQPGSVVRAILEASASVALWLQYLILIVLQSTRLKSSQGADVDSWLADFGLSRLPAVSATGSVVLSRYSSGFAATIPVGAIVRTADLSQSFAVVADSSNSRWTAANGGGYIVPVGVLAVTVPVQAVAPGTSGNVQAGSVSLLGTAIPGIDLVNNPVGFSDGVDPENDADFKDRFPLFVASLPKATKTAIESAIANVQQGLSYTVTVNVDEQGRFQPGHFVVTVDDGSGTPSNALKSSVYAAVDSVRALTESFSVQSPTIALAEISLSITPNPGYSKNDLVTVIQQAITGYIDNLGIGNTLPITMLAVIAYSAQPGALKNVTNVIVNGGTSDLDPGGVGTVKSGIVTVN